MKVNLLLKVFRAQLFVYTDVFEMRVDAAAEHFLTFSKKGGLVVILHSGPKRPFHLKICLPLS